MLLIDILADISFIIILFYKCDLWPIQIEKYEISLSKCGIVNLEENHEKKWKSTKYQIYNLV